MVNQDLAELLNKYHYIFWDGIEVHRLNIPEDRVVGFAGYSNSEKIFTVVMLDSDGKKIRCQMLASTKGKSIMAKVGRESIRLVLENGDGIEVTYPIEISEDLFNEMHDTSC